MRFPRFLRSMLRLAAREPGRFQIHGVHLVTKDGTTRCEVTNGRTLAVATYQDPGAKDGDIIVSALDVERLAGYGPKIEDTGEDEFGHIIAERSVDDRMDGELSVECDKPGEARISETVADLSYGAKRTPFPPVGDVLPTKAPVASILVNPRYLIEVLRACEDASSGNACAVWLSIQADPKAPMLVQPNQPREKGLSLATLVMGVDQTDQTRPALPDVPRTKPVAPPP